MIERDNKNQLTANSRAALAIKGMGPAEISDKVEACELLYYKWLGIEVNDEGFPVSRKWFTPWRELILRIARTPITIFRSQVADLALTCAKQMTDAKAAIVRTSFHAEYLKLVEQNRELRLFLGEHFPHDLKEAESRNIPVAQLIKEVMLRQKNRTPLPPQ